MKNKKEDSKQKKSITEKDNLQKEWYKEAREQTKESLIGFIDKLTNEYNHDYGTICHAIAAAAIGAAWAVERSPCGGITGFQAGAIMWEFVRHWLQKEDVPLRMIHYDDFLYPQYEDKFKSISKECWEWIQKEAKKNLKECKKADSLVKEHWKSIVNGKVPFGFKVEL